LSVIRRLSSVIYQHMLTDAPLRQTIQQGLRLDRAVKLVWRSAPGWTLVNLVLVLVQGLLPMAILYLTKEIVDAVAAGLSAPDKTRAFQEVLFWILPALAAGLLMALCRSLGDWAGQAQSLEVTDRVSDILHAQSVSIDLAYYEDPRFHNTLHRAQEEAPFRPTRIVNGLVQTGQNGLSLLGVVGLLFSFNWLVALVLFAAALPGALVRLLYARKAYRLEQDQTEPERRAWYFHWILVNAAYAKEVRLFHFGPWFQEQYRVLRKQLRGEKLALARGRAVADFFVQGLAVAVLFGALAAIAWKALQGDLSLGALVMYYQGFQMGLGYLQTLLRGLADLYEDNLFLSQFYDFLELKPRVQTPTSPKFLPAVREQGLAFEGVHFTYPGTPREVLTNVTLTLGPGEVIALVGENGSGKSTLIKLLGRLYDPTAGRILAEGIDLRDLDPVQWRQEISILFQDYGHYFLKARENIRLGRIEREPAQEAIRQAALQAGADALIRRLPQGYETLLGNWFEAGQELSIGEWQKVALARTFFREGKLLVLDEPSSSLDALAEAELFRGFKKLLQGRSAILISHRFSTAHLADRIYVLQEGRIVEQGEPEALLSRKGVYARLFGAQKLGGR